MTEPSQKALDYAARKAGFSGWLFVSDNCNQPMALSICQHAFTLDELWALKPPKTRGELFADELIGRWRTSRGYCNADMIRDIAAKMIDEGWEPKDD